MSDGGFINGGFLTSVFDFCVPCGDFVSTVESSFGHTKAGVASVR